MYIGKNIKIMLKKKSVERIYLRFFDIKNKISVLQYINKYYTKTNSANYINKNSNNNQIKINH